MSKQGFVSRVSIWPGDINARVNGLIQSSVGHKHVWLYVGQSQSSEPLFKFSKSVRNQRHFQMDNRNHMKTFLGIFTTGCDAAIFSGQLGAFPHT